MGYRTAQRVAWWMRPPASSATSVLVFSRGKAPALPFLVLLILEKKLRKVEWWGRPLGVSGRSGLPNPNPLAADLPAWVAPSCMNFAILPNFIKSTLMEQLFNSWNMIAGIQIWINFSNSLLWKLVDHASIIYFQLDQAEALKENVCDSDGKMKPKGKRLPGRRKSKFSQHWLFPICQFKKISFFCQQLSKSAVDLAKGRVKCLPPLWMPWISSINRL